MARLLIKNKRRHLVFGGGAALMLFAAAVASVGTPARAQPAPDGGVAGDSLVDFDRDEVWKITCFQNNEEVMTLTPVYRVRDQSEGLGGWQYVLPDGRRIVGRVGTNVTCSYENLSDPRPIPADLTVPPFAGERATVELSEIMEAERPIDPAGPLADFGTVGPDGQLLMSVGDTRPLPPARLGGPGGPRTFSADTMDEVQVAALPSSGGLPDRGSLQEREAGSGGTDGRTSEIERLATGWIPDSQPTASTPLLRLPEWEGPPRGLDAIIATVRRPPFHPSIRAEVYRDITDGFGGALDIADLVTPDLFEHPWVSLSEPAPYMPPSAGFTLDQLRLGAVQFQPPRLDPTPVTSPEDRQAMDAVRVVEILTVGGD